MKPFSKLLFGVWSAIIGGVLVLAAVEFTSQGRETNAPQIKIEQTPIERETRGVTSYSTIVKRAAPSVVNIFSTRTVRERESNPFFNDPFFRHFFGPPDDNNHNDDQQAPGQGRNRSRRPQPHPQQAQSLGSGVIISPDGYILTANHVVAGAEEIRVVLADGDQEYTAKVIGTDAPTDVAVLKISDKNNLPAVTITDSDRLEVGDVVLAIGNPFGVGQTVTMGIVSGLARTSLNISDYEDFIQTDAAINPGNSGGALVDAEGRLVGINTAIFSESGGYQGVGFAVPANLARTVMEQLIQHGKVTRGFLGVGIKSLTPDLAEAFNMPDDKGALVTDVRSNTPASKAGLQDGDVIREMNGKQVKDSSQLRLTISETAPGAKVTLKYLRGENDKKPVEHTTTVVLDKLPTETASNEENTPSGGGGSSYDSLDGVEVSDIDAGARQQFGIPSIVHGAVVTNVDENSNAAEAGLQPGDVIQEIDRKPVRNAEDAVKLSDKAHGKHVLLHIWTRAGGGAGASTYITVDNEKKK